MAAGEDGHQHLLDHVVLADDHFGQLVAEAVVGLFAALHGGNVIGGRGSGQRWPLKDSELVS